MRVWITKYALTSGIQEREVKQVCPTNQNMIELAPLDGECGPILFWKPHWHETREAAAAQAENMRVKKLTSLRRQIRKMEALRFDD